VGTPSTDYVCDVVERGDDITLHFLKATAFRPCCSTSDNGRAHAKLHAVLDEPEIVDDIPKRGQLGFRKDVPGWQHPYGHQGF
jgi:hypothetical protein